MGGLLWNKKRLKNHNHQNNVFTLFRNSVQSIKMLKDIVKDNQRSMNVYWVLDVTEELSLITCDNHNEVVKETYIFRDICQVYMGKMT